jgi:hypothetical protein
MGQMKIRWGGVFGAAAGAVLISAIFASSASAILRKLPDGQVASYQPLRGAVLRPNPGDTVFGNVDYNGGAVMPSNTDYLIFWSPKGLSAYGSGSPPEYVSGIEQYWKDLAHDSGMDTNTDSVSTQYNDLTGASAQYKVKYGGAFVDKDAYPTSECPAVSPVTNCLVDGQLQTELENFAAAHGLKTDLSHEFFLITPPNVQGCFDNNPTDPSGPYGGCSAGESVDPVYCAYHQETLLSPMLFYADDPYVTGNRGCDDGNHPNGASDGALEGGMSHEHNESITDPIPNDAWTNGAGSNQGEEIGDQCDGHMGAALGTAPNGAKYNQLINGHYYWYQEEWSNNGHSCLQRYTPPTTLPSASYSVTAGSGLAMTFNASASTAPGGIADFSWQFNAVANQSTFEQATPSITYTFPASGAYSTGMTVYANTTGLSRGTGGIITTGQNGFTPGFTYSPTSPTAGQTVTFSGLGTISQKPVTNWLWEFGDGTTGYGQDPTHVYAAAGKYKVEVIQFTGVGSAYPGSGAAPVSYKTITVG